VWDRIAAGIALTTWDTTTSQWGAPVTVTGVATGSYYDPCLADVRQPGGTIQTWLFWSYLDNIAGAEIDLTTGAVTGTPMTVINQVAVGTTANSPNPLCNSNGELICFSHHDVDNAAGDNDQYFSFDLDPTTPSMGPWLDTTTWINNGCMVGGTAFCCHWAPSPPRIYRADTYYTPGGRTTAGSTLEVSAYVPLNTANPIVSALMLGLGFSSPSIPMPGIINDLGLNPAFSIFVVSIGGHDPITGKAATTYPMPMGITGVIPCQAIALDSVTMQITLSNTAVIDLF
jgi:hypothetical protein